MRVRITRKIMNELRYTLGIDIGSTTVKVALLDKDNTILFSDYKRHYANIQETLASLIKDAIEKTGDKKVSPMITGSGGLLRRKSSRSPRLLRIMRVRRMSP